MTDRQVQNREALLKQAVATTIILGGKRLLLVRIFYSSDTSSEARQMNRRQILLINLLNRRQRFDSDARRLTLKDTDQNQEIFQKMVIFHKYQLFQTETEKIIIIYLPNFQEIKMLKKGFKFQIFTKIQSCSTQKFCKKI